MPRLLPEPAVPVALDVAIWFLDRARAEDGHLPAQKLQNLLYLAALHFERENDGRALMPAVFVANDVTVADPNVYRLLEEGRPDLRFEPVSSAVDAFLAGIWARYGRSPVAHLNAVVKRLIDAGPDAVPESPTPEAPLASKTAPPKAIVTAEAVPPLRPTHQGRHVAVTPWRPPSVPRKA